MRVATAFSIGVSSRISPSAGALWAAGGPAGAAGRVSSPLEIRRSTSALTTRPSGPLPLPAMAARSMPASSAMRRAIGETRSAAVAPEPLPAAALALDEDFDGLRAGAAFGSGSGSALRGLLLRWLPRWRRFRPTRPRRRSRPRRPRSRSVRPARPSRRRRPGSAARCRRRRPGTPWWPCRSRSRPARRPRRTRRPRAPASGRWCPPPSCRRAAASPVLRTWILPVRAHAIPLSASRPRAAASILLSSGSAASSSGLE